MTSIKSNLIYSTAYQILLIVLPLITGPYLARTLGPESIGIFAYVSSIVSYFLLFGMLGISNYGNRTIALAKSKEEKSVAFSEIYLFQIIIAFVTIVLYFIYLFYAEKFRLLFFIQSINVISIVFDVNWLFWGLEQFKITVIRNFIVKTLSFICILLFVKNSDDLYKYILIVALSSFISQLFLWFHLRKYIKIQFAFNIIKSLPKHIKPIFLLFIPILSYSIYKIMDKIMIGNLSSITELGYYENAEKFINLPLSFIAAFGNVMMPRISSLLSTNNLNDLNKYNSVSFKYFSILAVCFSFGLLGISNNLAVVFYGERFYNSGIIIAILSITILFVAWSNIIRTQYLIPNKKDNIYVSSTIFGAILNFVLNYYLIPSYNAVGAAIATVVTEFSVFIFQLIFIYKLFPIINYLVSVSRFILYGLASCFFIYFLCCYCSYNIVVVLPLQIIIFVFLYSSFVLLDLKFIGYNNKK